MIMPSFLSRPAPYTLSLFVLLAVTLIGLNTSSVAFGSDSSPRAFFSELNGLDSNAIVQQSVRVDFRPLVIKDVKSPRLDVELNYDVEIANGATVENISFIIPQSAAVVRLLLDSSSLSFRSKNVPIQEAKIPFGDLVLAGGTADQVQECQFDTSIPAGKHRLVIGLHLPIERSGRNEYRASYLCPSLSASKNAKLKLQYAIPDYWHFSANDIVQAGTDSQSELDSSEIKGVVDCVALENYPWDLNPKVAIQNVYEFDRRFSITGWIFMTAIAVTAFLAAFIVWYQGASQTAYGSLCLCGIMAVVGLGAAMVLPNESNQMRVVRQQDHDELVMLANRLLLNQLQNKPESIGEVVDADLFPILGGSIASPGAADSQDLSPAVVALMRQSKAVNLGDCFVSLEEATPINGIAKKPTGIHYVLLRDGPSTVSLYELRTEGSKLTSRLVGTSPVPTTMRMGAAISDSDVSEFHKSSLDKYLKP